MARKGIDLLPKARGALLGAALGDALGAAFEGVPTPAAADIDAAFLATSPLRWTDDTAMTIAFAESLLAVGDLDEDDLARTFARHWRAEQWRGYGRGTYQLLGAIEAGGSWRTLATSQFDGQGSWGNGAAMRVAPAAIAGAGDTDRTLDLARRSARVTHSHPLAVDGATLQAGAVGLALLARTDEPIEPAAFLERALGCVTEDAMVAQLDRLAALPARATPSDIATRIGHGIDALSSVPAAVAAALLVGGSLPDTIRFAIAIGGDTDTIASMAGAITGAHLGAEAIPAAWSSRLEAWDRLVELADRLTD